MTAHTRPGGLRRTTTADLPSSGRRGHPGARGRARALGAAAVALATAVWFLPAVTVTAQAAVVPSVRMVAVHLFHPTNPQAYAGGYEQAQVPIEYRCPYGMFVLGAVEMVGQAQIGGHFGANPAVQGLPACTGATQSAVITVALVVISGGMSAEPMLPGLQAMAAQLYQVGHYPDQVLASVERTISADTAPTYPQALQGVPFDPSPYRLYVHTGTTTVTASWRPPLDLRGHLVAGYRVGLDTWREPVPVPVPVPGSVVSGDVVPSERAGLSKPPSVALPASADHYSFTGLLPHTGVMVTVTVIFADLSPGGFTTGTWSTGATAWLPQPVTDVVVQPGPTTVTMRWVPPEYDGSSAVTGYMVARDGVDASGNGPYAAVVPGNATSCVFTNLRPGVVYTFSVRALNGRGLGPFGWSPSAAAG